jgi:hypothetical protein
MKRRHFRPNLALFDILHYTFLRLGDTHRFGPPHLRQIVRKMAVQIATEKSRGNTTVTVPVHPNLRKVCGRLAPRVLSAPKYSPAKRCAAAWCR